MTTIFASQSRNLACAVLTAGLVSGGAAYAQAPDLNTIPPYKQEYECKGGLRIFGNWGRGTIIKLAQGFQAIQPECIVATNFMTSSEGGLAGLYTGIRTSRRWATMPRSTT